MKKNHYYKLEAAQFILFPILLAICAFFVVNAGWVPADQVNVVWALVAIQTVASLLTLAVIYFLDG